MASEARLKGAVRLARSVVDSDHAPFMERELAWAVLALARAGAGAGKASQAGSDAREGRAGADLPSAVPGQRHPPL